MLQRIRPVSACIHAFGRSQLDGPRHDRTSLCQRATLLLVGREPDDGCIHVPKNWQAVQTPMGP